VPLTIPAEVATLQAARDYEFHATLDISFGNGDVVHISTANLAGVDTVDFGVIDYVDDLRESGQLNEALTLAVNRLDLRAQNVDGALGTILSDAQSLDGANAILSIVFIDDDDNKFQVEVLHGEISNSSDQDPDVSFQLVSHLTTDGPVGGFRTLQNSCFARYKIDPRCDSASPLSQACDHTKTGPNGCKFHLPSPRIVVPVSLTNEPSYLGFLYQIKPLPGTPPAGPTGIVDAGDDFNSYWKDRQSLGDYTGRFTVPHYLLAA
jgi:hypothetical protein